MGVQVSSVTLGQGGVPIEVAAEAVHLERVVPNLGRRKGGSGWGEIPNSECVDIFLTVTDNPAAAGLANRPCDVLKGDAVGVGFNDSVLLDGVAIAGQVPINPNWPGEVQLIPGRVCSRGESQR